MTRPYNRHNVFMCDVSLSLSTRCWNMNVNRITSTALHRQTIWVCTYIYTRIRMCMRLVHVWRMSLLVDQVFKSNVDRSTALHRQTIYICIYVHKCIHACMWRVHVWRAVSLCLPRQVYTCVVLSHQPPPPSDCIYICMYIYTYTCIYAYMYTCIHVYMHTCMYTLDTACDERCRWHTGK